MLDTIPHIIDSTKQVINIISPSKSNLETFVPYITIIVSFIVLFFTIRANRRQMKQDNLIKIRKEWIEDFVKLSSVIYEYVLLLKKDYKETDTSELIRVNKITYYESQLRLRNTIDGVVLQDVIGSLEVVYVHLMKFIHYKEDSTTKLYKIGTRDPRPDTEIELDNAIERFLLECISVRNIETEKLFKVDGMLKRIEKFFRNRIKERNNLNT